MSDPMAGRHCVPTVLVVDDDEGVRTVTRRTLEEAGFSVQEARDGLDALGLVAQGLVSIVVTDIRMPRMDGWELASRLKAMTSPPAILFISGYDAHVGVLAYPGRVLAKPFRSDQLVTEVRRLINGVQRSA